MTPHVVHVIAGCDKAQPCLPFTKLRLKRGSPILGEISQTSKKGNGMENLSEGHVTIVDIKMPFMSMVTFMVKAAIAAIPAVIILAVLGAIIGAMFGGMMR